MVKLCWNPRRCDNYWKSLFFKYVPLYKTNFWGMPKYVITLLNKNWEAVLAVFLKVCMASIHFVK